MSESSARKKEHGRKSGNSELVVYTALLGNGEDLQQAPDGKPGMKRILFTDRDIEGNRGWEVVKVSKPLKFDSRRSQRYYKFFGHPLIWDYKNTLYLDNTIQLKADPFTLWSKLVGEKNLGFPLHSYRKDISHEFQRVIQARRDHPSRVIEQLKTYEEFYPGIMELTPAWNGLIARKDWDYSWEFFEIWWQHLLRFSDRDQLSIMAALQDSGISANFFHMSNFESDWHKWPVREGLHAHISQEPKTNLDAGLSGRKYSMIKSLIVRLTGLKGRK